MDFIEPVANIEKSGKAIKNKIKMKRFYIKFEFLLEKKKRKEKEKLPVPMGCTFSHSSRGLELSSGGICP